MLGSWETQTSWLRYYQHVPRGAGDWPVGEAGQDGGPNVVNPLMGWALGLDPNYYNEVGRMQGLPAGPAATPSAAWELSKLQSGLMTADAAHQNVPALSTAQAYLAIVYTNINHTRSDGTITYQGPVYQTTAGGVFGAAPETGGTCTDPRTGNGYNEQTLTFNRFDGGAALTYSTCTYFATTEAFFFYIYDRSTGVQAAALDRSVYYEGPYTNNGKLGQAMGDHLLRLQQWYCMGMRGSDLQRTNADYNILDYGFDWERFFSGQYFLAPNLAKYDGTHLIGDFPHGIIVATNSAAPGIQSGTVAAYAAGWVLGGMLLTAGNLAAATTVNILDGATVLASAQLTPNALGFADAMVLFESAPNPQALAISLPYGASFTGNGFIKFEANKKKAYKPQIYDGFLLSRFYTLRAPDKDGDATQFDGAAQASSDYFMLGCINGSPDFGNPDAASQCGFVDMVRKLSRDSVRVVASARLIQADCDTINSSGGSEYSDAQEGTPLRAYEVIVESGVEKSVLTFNRNVLIDGEKFDAWDGLAPIVHKAPPKGKTNEWCMFLTLCPYSISATSLYKPSVTGDYFGLVNRCQFYERHGSGEWFNWVGWNQPIAIAPPTTSAFTYYPGTNSGASGGIAELAGDDATAPAKFYKSCQVYQKPYEIDRIEEFVSGGDELVRVIFKTRFQSTIAGSGAISSDVNSWDNTALDAEAYRTDENGIRMRLRYLFNRSLDHDGITVSYQAPAQMIGDTAAERYGASLWSGDDAARGAICAHFWFIKLAPRVYDTTGLWNTFRDMADTVWKFFAGDPDRTLCTVEDTLKMDMNLAAICEGFVDNESTIAYGCATDSFSLIDYNYESLCIASFGQRSTGILPHSKRSPEPVAYGPLPRITMYAETFNRHSLMLNRLNRARLYIPIKFQYKFQNYLTPQNVDVQSCGIYKDCGTTSFQMYAGPAVCGTTFTDGDADWRDDGLGGASSSCGFAVLDSPVCSGTQAILYGSKQNSTYRVIHNDADALNCIPDHLLEFVQGGKLGVLATITTTASYNSYSEVALSTDGDQCYNGGGNVAVNHCSGGYSKTTQTITTTTECKLVTGGTWDAGCPSGGVFYRAYVSLDHVCTVGSSIQMEITPHTSVDTTFIEIPLA